MQRKKSARSGLIVSSEERSSSASNPPGARCARAAQKKLHRVEPVQLRRLRVRHIHDDHVEFFSGFGQESPPIQKMQMHARVGIEIRRLRREKLPRHANQRRVQLHIIEPLDGRMLQRLGHGAVHAAANQEYAAWRRVLQQRVVHRLFGRGRIGRIGQDRAVLVNAPDFVRVPFSPVSVTIKLP